MISTVTINTAIDRLLFIEELHKNNTNRIKRTVEVLGGKGAHVSLNLSQLGMKNRSFGVVLGVTGSRILQILKDNPYIDVKMLHYDVGDSRTNYAIIEDDNTCTLIAEKGVTISKPVCEELLNIIDQHTEDGDYLVLSGDASNTEVPFIYNVIMERLQSKKIKVFLDASSENLIKGVKAKPFLVKPNVDELSQFVGHPVETEADILHGMDELESYGVEVIAVTCGANGSYVRYKGVTYRVYPLKVNVVNTIGCGDAYLSGFVYGLSNNMPFETVLRYATAVSAATAESELSVGFDPRRAESLIDQVIIETL